MRRILSLLLALAAKRLQRSFDRPGLTEQIRQGVLCGTPDGRRAPDDIGADARAHQQDQGDDCRDDRQRTAPLRLSSSLLGKYVLIGSIHVPSPF